MKILVYGAGVLGSLYAARLKRSGQDVTILARGQRYDDIRRHGIVLEHALSHAKEVVMVPAVESLPADEAYDLIVVLVRKSQVASLLPVLAAHQATPDILFMVNNPSGYDQWIDALGPTRLVFGFAGAGGVREDNVVRYVVMPRFIQPTTFGEVDGCVTPRIRQIMGVFRGAGFPCAFTPNMDAWQKTHVAWVSPVANAIYMAGGQGHELAESPHAIHLLVRAVREGYRVLHSLGVPVTPARLRLWQWLPEQAMAALIRRWAGTRLFRTVVVAHTLAAADEMWQLAEEFHALAAGIAVATPAMDELRTFIPLPEPPEARS